MSYNEVRRPYEFSYEVKKQAYEKQPVCEGCGHPQTESVRLHADHIIPVWFAIKYPVFATACINSIANLRILCPECHSRRNHYDTTEILALAQVVMIRFVEHERLKNERSPITD